MKQLSEALPPMQPTVSETIPKSSLSNTLQPSSINDVGKSITALQTPQDKPSLTLMLDTIERDIAEGIHGLPETWNSQRLTNYQTTLSDIYFKRPTDQQKMIATAKLCDMAEAYGFKVHPKYITELKDKLDKIPADLLDIAVERVRDEWGSDNYRIPTVSDLEKAVDSELSQRLAVKSKLQVVEMFLKLRGQ